MAHHAYTRTYVRTFTVIYSYFSLFVVIAMQRKGERARGEIFLGDTHWNKFEGVKRCRFLEQLKTILVKFHKQTLNSSTLSNMHLIQRESKLAKITMKYHIAGTFFEGLNFHRYAIITIFVGLIFTQWCSLWIIQPTVLGVFLGLIFIHKKHKK